MKLRHSLAVLVAVLTGLAIAPKNASALPTPPNPLAQQRKAVSDAQHKLDDARKQLLVIRRKVEVVFEAKPEFKLAKDAMEKSRAEYEAAGRKVTAALEKTTPYKALIAKRDKAQAIVESATSATAAGSDADAPKITPEDQAKARADHVAAVFAMKAMEKEAMEADSNYATLKQKNTDALAAWTALETQVDDAVKLDPAYGPAEKAVEQAEAALKQANDSLAQAAKAQRDAAAAASKARAKAH
jgi:hypothetical protein